MERVVKPRDRPRCIAKGRVRGDVGNALAINVDFAAIAQALEIFGAGERAALGADGVLAFHPVHEGSLLDPAATPNPGPSGGQGNPRRTRLFARVRLARLGRVAAALL